MPHFLIMTIPRLDIDPAPLEARLDKAKDWIRFAPGCWLIYTKYSADAWFSQICDLPELEGTMAFLCEANLEDLSGQLDPFAWDWIKRLRGLEANANRKAQEGWIAAAESVTAPAG
jgi:hypothetical protein